MQFTNPLSKSDDPLAFGKPAITKDKYLRVLTFGDSPLGNQIIEVFNKNGKMESTINDIIQNLNQLQRNDLAAYVSNHKKLDRSDHLVWGKIANEITNNTKKKGGGKSRRSKSRRSKSRRSKSRRTVKLKQFTLDRISKK